jgi:hypothetical protein
VDAEAIARVLKWQAARELAGVADTADHFGAAREAGYAELREAQIAEVDLLEAIEEDAVDLDEKTIRRIQTSAPNGRRWKRLMGLGLLQKATEKGTTNPRLAIGLRTSAEKYLQDVEPPQATADFRPVLISAAGVTDQEIESYADAVQAEQQRLAEELGG